MDVLINDFIFVSLQSNLCLPGRRTKQQQWEGSKSAFKWEPCTLEEREGLGVCHRKKTSKMQILPKNKGN